LRVLRKMHEMPEIIQFAIENTAPHQIAFYALDLAGMFNPVYDRVLVLSERDNIPEGVSKARLRFYRAAKVVFKRCLDLMGMNAPEIMIRREEPKKAEEQVTAAEETTETTAE
jgi:arginyl-tRNA synthetase